MAGFRFSSVESGAHEELHRLPGLVFRRFRLRGRRKRLARDSPSVPVSEHRRNRRGRELAA